MERLNLNISFAEIWGGKSWDKAATEEHIARPARLPPWLPLRKTWQVLVCSRLHWEPVLPGGPRLAAFAGAWSDPSACSGGSARGRCLSCTRWRGRLDEGQGWAPRQCQRNRAWSWVWPLALGVCAGTAQLAPSCCTGQLQGSFSLQPSCWGGPESYKGSRNHPAGLTREGPDPLLWGTDFLLMLLCVVGRERFKSQRGLATSPG